MVKNRNLFEPEPQQTDRKLSVRAVRCQFSGGRLAMRDWMRMPSRQNLRKNAKASALDTRT